MEVLSGENTADGICSISEKVYCLKYPTLSALIRASAMGLAALEVDTPTKPLGNAITLPQPTPPTLSGDDDDDRGSGTRNQELNFENTKSNGTC